MSAFHARVLASDTDFFDGPCEFMVVPCTDGAMGILPHHSNMIAAVVPGELRFQPEGGSLRTAAVSAGLVKIEDGDVLLLVDTAERPEDIDANRLFIYTVNGRLEAVFAFILGVDPTYQVIEDGAWLNDTLPYGTIHRLASSGKSKGVASAVIEWCLEHCQSLRADTHADNQIMQHLLEKNGFTRCGIIHVADGTPRIAYQKLALTQQHS